MNELTLRLCTVTAYVQWREFWRLARWWALRDREQALLFEDLGWGAFRAFVGHLTEEPWWDDFVRELTIPDGTPDPDAARVKTGVLEILGKLGVHSEQ